MGNVCGCVRSPREECYLDPSKAPLSLEPRSPREPRGRRYFQRRKKRKSGDLLPTDSLRSQGGDSVRTGSETWSTEHGGDAGEAQPRPGGTPDRGVYVGKVPVSSSSASASSPRGVRGRSDTRPKDRNGSWSPTQHGLHGVTKASKYVAPKENLLERRLLRLRIRRVVSFGAVEHRLRTVRGDEGSSRRYPRFFRVRRRGSTGDVSREKTTGIPNTVWTTRVSSKENGPPASSGDSMPQNTLGKHYSGQSNEISDIHVTGESEDMTAKERLLLWSQQMTEGYTGVRCDNFTSSWRDGRLFNAIIHKYRPDLVDMGRVSVQSSRSNLEQAFGVAEQLGVARLLDPEDVDVQSPDEKSVITYVSTLYDVFPKVPEGVEGINANDVDIKWVEYQNMVNYLSQWIKHHVAVMSDRNFPSNPAELKALYTQYLQFKENEIPAKENEKTKIKHLYKMLEVWMEFGRIELPQGYHPNDVEKEWGKLIISMLEREKSLRPEVDSSISSVSNSSIASLENHLIGGETTLPNTPLSPNNNSVYGPRLEMLQQLASRVQRDCVLGEEKLALTRGALQADTKRLESGIQFQHETEIAGYLLECETILRQLVVDIQTLMDGKFHTDQLVQKISKLRDDLMITRSDCSSVYNQGQTLTNEQTKMMISGISQSLNSGFSSNLNSGLSPALTAGLTGGGLASSGTGVFSSGLPPSLTTVLPPSLQPGSLQAYIGCGVGAGGAVDPGALQQLKLMQIRKPLLKSAMVDSNMSVEDVNMNFVQDLLNWVEEMQVQLDRGEWGSDLPSVETHLENHKSMHRAIEEFQMTLKEAKMGEIQMTSQKQSYSDKLANLETAYGKLLNTSKTRQKNLESLHDLVSRATQELIWLNEKEEEEVAFDWSDRNGNISRKRDYHADLMRELDDKEGAIRSVQDRAEQLLGGNHPARLTIEAYRAAMQTQWSWILQLCSCVEQHLRENAVYFEFFTDAKDAQDYLKSLQEMIQRKYGCDRSSSLHRLEDLVQESMDEKEALLQYRSTVASLVGRAKSIVQLKPRSSDHPVRSSIPVKAICDYRQIEITIYKEDECVLANNSHRAKWKVISPSGNEAMVPSVCFTVPPPNKEAMELVSRIEQLYQNVLALWHHSHINMKSVVSWHYLMTDIKAVRNASVSSVKTLLPGDHQLLIGNLQSHLEGFMEDSDESEVFSMSDRAQLEREVEACKEYYEELLRTAEREEHEESIYNLLISEVRTFRMRLEGYEERLLRQIRTPLDRDDLEESVRRIVEQEFMQNELDRLKEDLEALKEKCEAFVSQASASILAPTLSSELSVLLHSMSQVYSMSSVYLEKLKSVSLVVRHSQGADTLVKLYEAKLCEEDGVNADNKAIEAVMSTLKLWRSEIDENRAVFHDLEDELQKARGISDRMFKTHNERDFDLDWHKEKADQLSERWHSVHSQIDSRLRDLEGIGKTLKYYRDAYGSLDEWIREMEANQRSMQENQPEDSKALAELLNQQKVLVSEIEQKQSRIEECQKYSEQYSAAVKDYELQLMTYMAMVDSQHKSPIKRRRMQSSSDAILQEFMDLRTRYTALVTLMTQYVKFASETLKRTEEEERRKGEYITWTETWELQKSTGDEEITRLQQRVSELESMLAEKQQQQDKLEGDFQAKMAEKEQRQDKLEGELENERKTVEELTLQKAKLEHEVKRNHVDLEAALQGKAALEKELLHARQLIQQSEARQSALEESLLMLKRNIEESTLARRKLEEHLRRKDNDVQGLEEHKRTLEMELKAKEGTETKLMTQLRGLEIQFTRPKEPIVPCSEVTLLTSSKVTTTNVTLNNSVHSQGSDIGVQQNEQSEDLQHKLDEMAMGRKKAEIEIKTLKSEMNMVMVQKNVAEEKAQRLKDLLEEGNNRLKRIQMDMESERSSTRQKTEEMRQEVAELKRSVFVYQEQLKSLQRDKSTLEQKVVFHMTEIEGLKEQLKMSQGKLLQMTSVEQESNHNLRRMEDELINKQKEGDKLKFTVNELTRTTAKQDNDIRNLKVSVDSLHQERIISEQKVKAQKSEIDSLRELLQKTKEEFALKVKSEQGILVKAKNMEIELENSSQLVSQLRKNMEELKNILAETERSMKNVKIELDKAKMEIGSKDQQISIFKSQVDSAKSQLKIIEEELLKKTQTTHELQIKLRDYDEEVKKSYELLQKNKSQSLAIATYEKDVTSLRSELNSLSAEKRKAEQHVQEQKAEINNLSLNLKKTKDELQKEVKTSHELHLKLRDYNEEVKKSAELQQRNKALSLELATQEKDMKNLKSELNTVSTEKGKVEQQVLDLKTEISHLNATIKKTSDELRMETQTVHELQIKVRNYNEEVKKSAELQQNNKALSLTIATHEKDIRNLKSELNTISTEKRKFELQVQEQKTEMNNLNIRLKKVTDELQKEKQTTHELQMKVRDYSEELKKLAELQQKNKSLSLEITTYEKDIRNVSNEKDIKKLTYEFNSVSEEKKKVDKKVLEQKSEIDDLTAKLRKAMDELKKETADGQRHSAKVNELQAEVQNYKQTMNDLSGNSEKVAVNLKKEVVALQSVKKVSDQELVTLKAQLNELNAALQKTKDELKKEAQEGKKYGFKITELEKEVQSSKQSFTEVNSSSEKLTLSLKQEISVLQKERSVARGEAQSLMSEVTLLKKKLEQTQEEVKQKQKETSAAQLKAQGLEEQVQNCKQMLEDLKGKLELQKKGHESELEVLRTEMEQKLALQRTETSLKMEREKKSRDNLYTTEVAEREKKYLQEIEQLKTLNQEALKLKKEAQQQVDVLHVKFDKGEKEKSATSQEMIVAKTRIAELEKEKVKLTARIAQTDKSLNEITKDNVTLKQTVAETERKLAIGEKESRSFKEQVSSYIKDVKDLQEKVLKLEVMERECQRNHQCFKDNELAKLKTELMTAKEMVTSQEEELRNLKIQTSSVEAQGMQELTAKKQAQINASSQVEVQKQTQKQTKSQAQELTMKKTTQTSKITQIHSQETHHTVITSDVSVTLSEEMHSGHVTSMTNSSHHKDTQAATTSISSVTLKNEEAGEVAVGVLQHSVMGLVGQKSAIAGIYTEASKKKISFLEASEKGFLAQTYAAEFLEAQAATGQIIDYVTGKTYSVQDALEKGIVEEELKEKLLDAERAVTGYTHGSRVLSVFQAMESRILDRHKGRKIIEVQIATGGLVDPQSGIRVPLDMALEKGLIDKSTLQTLYDPVSNPKAFHNPDTGHKAYYCELLKTCVYDVDGHVFLLPFGSRHVTNVTLARPSRLWVISSSSGTEMSTFEAYRAKLIDRDTYLLLSQQENVWEESTELDSSGGTIHILTDLRSGRQLCIERCLVLKILIVEELQKYRAGLLKINELADLLISRRSVSEDPHSPIAGLWDISQMRRLPVLKGHQQNLLDRLTTVRLLEAQACTGGICDPLLGEKFTVAEALQRGLIDDMMVRQVQLYEQAYRGIAHPRTGVLLSVAQAMQQGLFPRDVGLKCLEFQALTGGLVQPGTLARISVEEAARCGLIDETIAAHLTDEKSYAKNLTCPKTKRKISFKEALEKGVYDCHTGLKLLRAVKSHNVGVESSFYYIFTYPYVK
ncbi:hypothetical protein COCON_G00222340 [Conger conger]|uniref:Dystonin n=1 Tax=Conger conger TaxID=82655 RepID=A0A9Q1CWS0_CONCO|nr:hypothetical protein COCON_G00222340 [Conger conger]